MLKLSSQKATKTKSEMLVIPVCQDHMLFSDPEVVQLSQEATELVEFSGKKDQVLTFYTSVGSQAKRILFVGMGEAEKLDQEGLRRFAGTAVKRAIKSSLSRLDILVPEEKNLSILRKDQIQAICEGAELANHIYQVYKNEKKQHPLKSIRLLTTPSEVKKYTELLEQVSAICQATLWVREWVNMPSNDKPPLIFADMVAQEARSAKLKVTLIKEKELIEKKFGALLAVASGSTNRPCLLILEYSPPQPKNCVALVGKGVMFDSGGISLKPAAGMGDMKSDMAGAATVAATLIAAAKLSLKTKIIGVLPLVENLPSGSAFRPGDIVRSYNGKTIEIGNTDAEGRLILADAMGYTVDKFNPDLMIDLATLTGACMVALGEKIAGVFGNDDTLCQAIVKSGNATHERCWQMPMPDDYQKLIKSDVADIRNVGKNRWGGAITAALFLKAFVSETRWAHIDIAGPAYGKNTNAYTPSGASGFGVRLLCDLLQNIYENGLLKQP